MTSALDVLHSLRIEDGRRWGQAAYAFQREDAEAILRGEPPFHFLTHARGSSKTGDQAGIVLSLLLTVGARERIYWLAADQEQGQLCIDSIRGFVDRTPRLRRWCNASTATPRIGQHGSGSSVQSEAEQPRWFR